MRHAPRQTGKTSALPALCDLPNGQGYGCVYAPSVLEAPGKDRFEYEAEGRPGSVKSLSPGSAAFLVRCGMLEPNPAPRAFEADHP